MVPWKGVLCAWSHVPSAGSPSIGGSLSRVSLSMGVSVGGGLSTGSLSAGSLSGDEQVVRILPEYFLVN